MAVKAYRAQSLRVSFCASGGALENGQAARNGVAASGGGISVAGTGAPQAATDNASYRPITRQAVHRYGMGSLVGGRRSQHQQLDRANGFYDALCMHDAARSGVAAS